MSNSEERMDSSFENGFTRFPYSVLNGILLDDLKKRELKVVLLVGKLTYGCHKDWATLRQADLGIIGISASHARDTLNGLISSKRLLLNHKTKEIQINNSYFSSKVPKTETIKHNKLATLVGKHIKSHSSQKSNRKLTNSGRLILPKREMSYYQKGNIKELPKREVSNLKQRDFSSPKDILKDKILNSDINTIADNKNVINFKTPGETAAYNIWKRLEPNNPLSLITTYLWAHNQDFPTELFYVYASEIEQSNSRNKGAVFKKKVQEYFKKRKI